MTIRGVIFDLYDTLTGPESEWSDLPWTSDVLGIDRRQPANPAGDLQFVRSTLKRSTKMPYALNAAGNVMAIAECEHGAGAAIQFTRFTSCVGVIAKVAGANNVIGIHLVLVDANQNTFAAGDVGLVTAALTAHNYDNTTCHVIGQMAVWRASANAALTALIAALNTPQEYPLDDGTYGATINAGQVELTFV